MPNVDVPTGLLLSHAAAGMLTELRHQYPDISEATMAQEALRLADDPKVFADFPRQCRMIRERRDRQRAARSASLLSVRSEV